MPNSREHDHFTSNKFIVEIEGVSQGSFAEVSGLESITEVIEYADGSEATLRKRPGRTKYSNIVLTRGVTSNFELWGWYQKVIAGKLVRQSGSVVVLGDDMSEKYRYNFFEAWPCRWRSLELDASSNTTLIEELEIVVEKIERA